MYLYYPHAPILLRIVRHVKRSKRVEGGYRWEQSGRQGYLGNDEADAALRRNHLMIVSDDEAKDLMERLPDMVAARLRYSQNLQRRLG
jgi:hypothetical protein